LPILLQNIYIENMPRKPRIFVAGAVHHVMARGIDGKDIFADDEDRQLFLSYLSAGIFRLGYRCYAWTLMPNHYHLLLRANEKPLWQLMRPLNSNYGLHFNRKYQRRGYLFQDRYRSIVTQDQNYVEELVRYIHLNPIRAGLCTDLDELEEYAWSGHRVLLGRNNCDFQDTKDVLRRFGADLREARAAYRWYLDRGLQDSKDLLNIIRESNDGRASIHNTGSWIIGDREFVSKALTEDKLNRARLKRYAAMGWNSEKLCVEVARFMGVEVKQILRRSRGGAGSAARKVFGYVGYRLLGIPVKELANYLGICGPSLSEILDEGENIAKERGIDNLLSYLRPW
jgi:putative transposase